MGMSYTPYNESADPVGRYLVAGHQAVLLDSIVSAGSVEYLYLLVVYDAQGESCFFVASEVNSLCAELGGGSHFLGVFLGEGHANHGSSNDWPIAISFWRGLWPLCKKSLDRMNPRPRGRIFCALDWFCARLHTAPSGWEKCVGERFGLHARRVSKVQAGLM